MTHPSNSKLWALVAVLRAVACLLLTAGCATLAPTPPVVVDRIASGGPSWWPFQHQTYATVATTAQRRLIVISFDQSDSIPRFCAEPPPDVADDVVASLKAAVQGTYAGATLGGDVTQALSSVVSHLAPRSQGLQFYRDGMFYLCQAWLNDLIDVEEFNTRESHLVEAARELMRLEIPLLRLGPPGSPPTP